MDAQGTTVATTAGSPDSPAGSRAPQQAPGGGFPRWVVVFGALVIALGVGSGAYEYWKGGQRESPGAEAGGHEAGGHEAGGPAEGKSSGGMMVEVAHPRQGGIERTTTQAGSVHAFEHAQLYSKISGYLKVQNVDIGDRVKIGQLLAVIEDPEVDKAVEQNLASLDQARARVHVAEAKIKSTTADRDAADAMVKQAKTEVDAKVSNHELQQKQLARIAGLVRSNAVEAKLQDEQQDRLDVSTSDLGVAHAAVLTAQATVMAKAALIEEAQADLSEAKSNVGIAQANLDKAKVFQDYTRITSPYDGVITLRSFHRGDFIRAATEGGGVPVLAVARTELMRVVVPVPDVDVPFVDKGDQATLQIVALPGVPFKGVVSRYSETEDPQSRNMRTEIDLPNPDGRLHEGMYGRVTIKLQPAARGSVTIPSSGLLDQSNLGEGSVYLVRGGKAHKVPVKVGSDNGVQTEILSGLSPEDQVIVRYNGSIAEGTPVTAEASKAVAVPSGH